MTAPDHAAVEAAVAHVRQIHTWRAERGYASHDYGDDAIATLLDAVERLTELADDNAAVTLAERNEELRDQVEQQKAELERVEQERDGATGLAALLNQIWASGAVVIPQVSREFEVSYSVSWRFNNREHVKRVEWDYDAQEWRALPAEQEAADLAERDEPGGDSR